ncbi:M20/M25/M40 family metallo-hydrolase [Virgibacillus necropolis]|uniref:M20/M25/M40 family metallo-hydrolase n=1 Tax=Virgibacillus necropolis TaxID=163877 RepID=UPI0029C84B15|nr:M20/M25/M40 family metallo-hydrolase [Virgibacillus necropolis]
MSFQLEGTVRKFNEKVRQNVKDNIHSIVKGITEGFQATYKIDYLLGYPALFNHREETETVKGLFKEMFTESAVINLETSKGAEDFAYFSQEKPEHILGLVLRMKRKIPISLITTLNLILMKGHY